jgi:primosomal replication protein N
MSPCLGRLKSFFATRTPSVVTVCQPILQHESCDKIALLP